MTPLVSILIPAYNAAATLGYTLRSALAQSWPRTEIIVVDDGSRDVTVQVAAGFASAQVKVVRQENRGAAAARNHALALAQGDLIQWLDADDLLSVDKVAHQATRLASAGDPHVVASCGWASFRCRPLAARFRPGPLWHDLEPVEWMVRKWETNTYMQTATWLVGRGVSESAGPWNPALSFDDDGEYFSRVIARSTAILFVPDSRVYYRESPHSRLSYIGGSSGKLESLCGGIRLQIELLLSLRDDERTRSACKAYIETWLPEFVGHREDLMEELMQLASSLGHDVAVRAVGWKYRWIAGLAGQRGARQVQLRYNYSKAGLLRRWDALLARVQPLGIDISRL